MLTILILAGGKGKRLDEKFLPDTYIALKDINKYNNDESIRKVIIFGIYLDVVIIIISIIYMISINIVMVGSIKFMSYLSFICIYLVVDLTVIEKLTKSGY
ncbi:hypothetical protein [Oceanirhabdus sp. W0125-5]|uniref:hypothetical protein n=1 Tax=Oceanirhabdus sp. W0125-5 TaxID=2999116 RepID=UPI0022F313D3|nr:hypothetical protein [Oceanirhabdus sp. W0125-5]WBW98972.1 hypothetical protein OW730_09560 [Oceanirhabdus sp. W0125-5]